MFTRYPSLLSYLLFLFVPSTSQSLPPVTTNITMPWLISCVLALLQPMHVGFTSDQGGNSIELRWFRHKSNLHHVINELDLLLSHDLCFAYTYMHCTRFHQWD